MSTCRSLFRYEPDVSAGDLVFRGDDLAVTLDFDFLGIRGRLYDLAYTTYWLVMALGLDPSAASDWRKMRTVIQAYDELSRVPLPPLEREAIPFMLAPVPLYWVAEAVYLPDPIAAANQAQHGGALALAVVQSASHITGAHSSS